MAIKIWLTPQIPNSDNSWQYSICINYIISKHLRILELVANYLVEPQIPCSKYCPLDLNKGLWPSCRLHYILYQQLILIHPFRPQKGQAIFNLSHTKPFRQAIAELHKTIILQIILKALEWKGQYIEIYWAFHSSSLSRSLVNSWSFVSKHAVKLNWCCQMLSSNPFAKGNPINPVVQIIQWCWDNPIIQCSCPMTNPVFLMKKVTRVHHNTINHYCCRLNPTPIQPIYTILRCHSNPSSAEATFVLSTRMQRFLKTILTLSCWYSLESSHWVLSDEYPYARVSVIFQPLCIILYWPY